MAAQLIAALVVYFPSTQPTFEQLLLWAPWDKVKDFLDLRLSAIDSGRIPRDQKIISLAMLYGQGLAPAFENQRTAAAKRLGYSEALRVLSFSEHCQSGRRPGCVELADLGWVPISTLVPIGDAECLTNCMCHVDYRKQVII